MRSLAFVSVFLLAFVHLSCQQQYTEEQQKKIAQYREECVKETGVDAALINRADQGDFAEDDKLKCFSKCFYQKVGFINDAGEILVDVIEKKLPQGVDVDKAKEVIGICKELKGANACETSYLVHKCFFENNKKYLESQAAAQTTAAPAS